MFNYYPVTSCLDNISFTCGIHDSVVFFWFFFCELQSCCFGRRCNFLLEGFCLYERQHSIFISLRFEKLGLRNFYVVLY